MSSPNKTIPIVCSLTGLKVLRCPVTTCAYHTRHETENCMIHRNLTEDIDFHAQEIADCKGVSEETFRSQAQKGQKQIQRILVVHDFLLWCSDRRWQDYPKVAAYKDPELVAYVNDHLAHSFPFHVKLLPWNMGKIAASVTDKWWKEYSRAKDIDFVSISVSLGIPNRKVVEVQEAFSQALKRATRSK